MQNKNPFCMQMEDWLTWLLGRAINHVCRGRTRLIPTQMAGSGSAQTKKNKKKKKGC
jgi:hypothetical protein